MPALLLLTYCEHGDLLRFVTDAKATELNTSMLLTFCADVAAGMSYLSSRRIVHRDIAARNVLLNSQLKCLVSDFGMSTALGEDNDAYGYAAQYIRNAGELPIRWAAIEVLNENKYSRASDVWSFGVLVYEVMSKGVLPYAEMSTLMEVSTFVKGGGTMGCPEGCPAQVHIDVMAPCWTVNPAGRPGFAELRRRLLGLGADGAEQKDSTRPVSNPSRKATSRRGNMSDRALLGPSVHHLNSVLLSKVLAAVQPPWTDKSGATVDPPEAATIAHAVQAVVKPSSATRKSPRDGKPGCAYVDALKGSDHVGTSTVLLSYTWSYKVASVAGALQR
eukprot:m.84916 g.84916  ORF g.84916 m.84916 type:complete len:332 (-) comp11334_c1_seq1:49-1044(-)